ncbi:hypothetical protein [Streptomyces sp. LN785]|uniref:hypothetical protein n=1 Tax=Streptomyces sp. LN785 TaxID=3112983 RepID=UPI00371DBD05
MFAARAVTARRSISSDFSTAERSSSRHPAFASDAATVLAVLSSIRITVDDGAAVGVSDRAAAPAAGVATPDSATTVVAHRVSAKALRRVIRLFKVPPVSVRRPVWWWGADKGVNVQDDFELPPAGLCG